MTMSHPTSDFVHSRLGFGCASVMGKVSKQEGLRAMHMAHEQGIRHFDIARSYGFGRAESVLGEFMRGRRDQVSVTTKFGVVPPNLSWKTKALMPVARFVAEQVPAVANRLRKRSGEVLAQKRFDIPYAQACLEHSLRELGTDHIDVYLLHEPPKLPEAQQHDLAGFMQGMVQAGKVRHWGVACQHLEDLQWARTMQADVLQVEGHLMNAHALMAHELGTEVSWLLTRPFCGGLTPAVQAHTEAVLPGTLHALQQLGLTLGDFALAVAMRLAGAHGSVIGAMYTPRHIQQNARAMQHAQTNLDLQKLVDQWLATSRTPNNEKRL